MEAPERIWIDTWGGKWASVAGGTQEVEYIRADLLEAHIGAVLEEAANTCGKNNGPWRSSAWECREAILALRPTDLTALDRAKREARVEMFEQIWAAIERLHVKATAVDALNAIAPIIRALIKAERGKP